MQARVIRTDFGEVKARSRRSKRSRPNFRPPFTSGYPANGGLSDRSAAATASSNCCSSQGDIPRSPATTFLAHSMYSNRRLTDQSAAGLDAMARRLLVLSANLIVTGMRPPPRGREVDLRYSLA